MILLGSLVAKLLYSYRSIYLSIKRFLQNTSLANVFRDQVLHSLAYLGLNLSPSCVFDSFFLVCNVELVKTPLHY